MEQQQIYQLKLASLQAAEGDVDHAQLIYNWLTKEAQEVEAAKEAAKNAV